MAIAFLVHSIPWRCEPIAAVGSKLGTLVTLQVNDQDYITTCC